MRLAVARAVVAGAIGLIATAGCATAPLRIAALDEMERARAGAGSRESAERAPEAYARAEQERAEALRERAAGDDVGAAIHAQRAIAAYEHALVVARMAQAAAELADAQKSLDDATAQDLALDGARAKLEADATDLEERAQIARQRKLPASSAAASSEREAARLIAARSFTVEARLLCGAARLVSSNAPGAKEAEAALGEVDARLDKSIRPVPIDDAARLRAQCLDVLTRTHRGVADARSDSDALLAELAATGGWGPARDERGVVVTLRGAFQGPRLTPQGAARLADLGRVAAAHSGFAVQVVVHDAQPPPVKDDGDAQRAAAAIQAIVGAGAASGRIKSELAGAHVPVVDPADAKLRARNERLDVVFVPAPVDSAAPAAPSTADNAAAAAPTAPGAPTPPSLTPAAPTTGPRPAPPPAAATPPVPPAAPDSPPPP